MPNEALTIRGLFFGNEKGTSSVYFSDIKAPVSFYEKWNRFEIVVRIPEEVSFGIVRVRNSYGFSNGKLFTGQKAIPQVEEGRILNMKPFIETVEPLSPSVGETVRLQGIAFGDPGNAERLLFSSSTYVKEVSVHAFETQSWNPDEIRCRMPEGFFDTATVTVITRYGESQSFEFQPQCDAVKRRFGEEAKLQAQLSVSAVCQGILPAEATFILPAVLPGDRQLPTAVKGGSVWMIGNREFRVFKTQLTAKEKYVASVDFKVKLKSVAYEPQQSRFFADFARPAVTAQISPPFAEPAREFVAGKINLVDFVAALQERFDAEFQFQATDSPEEAAGESAVDKPFAQTKIGDAFDFAVLFADILQKSGVEARVAGGCYLTSDGGAAPHAWVEYFYPGFGFVAKDPSAGKNGFDDSFVENAPVAGGISCRYLKLFDRDEKLPARLYKGRLVQSEDPLFSRQNFYAELTSPDEEIVLTPPTLTQIKFR